MKNIRNDLLNNAYWNNICVVYTDSATIKAVNGRYSGYGVGTPTIHITGGTIEALEYGVISDFADSVVTIDNTESGSPITIIGGVAGTLVSDSATYIVKGTPIITP